MAIRAICGDRVVDLHSHTKQRRRQKRHILDGCRVGIS
jgi:hypothetical protein